MISSLRASVQTPGLQVGKLWNVSYKLSLTHAGQILSYMAAPQYMQKADYSADSRKG